MLTDRPDDWQEHRADLMGRDIESIATAEKDLLENDDDTNAEAAEPGSDGCLAHCVRTSHLPP